MSIDLSIKNIGIFELEMGVLIKKFCAKPAVHVCSAKGNLAEATPFSDSLFRRRPFYFFRYLREPFFSFPKLVRWGCKGNIG